MWKFSGKYTGEAKAYLKGREKKMLLIVSAIVAVVFIAVFVCLAFAEPDLFAAMLWIGAGGIAVFESAIFLLYRLSEPKVTAEITNNSFDFHGVNGNFSLPFYRIVPIEYHDDFIVLAKAHVLQRDLLVEGSWEELVALIKKIEDSLDTDEPLLQIEEPRAEFIEAKVAAKRIYEQFVHKGSARVIVGAYRYFATFESVNGTTAEYEIGEEYYNRIQEGQTGTLVLMNGSFFDFGDGEDLEEEN